MCVCVCVCVYAVSMSAPLSSLVLCKFLLFIHVLNNPLYKLAEALCFFISAYRRIQWGVHNPEREREGEGERERCRKRDGCICIHFLLTEQREAMITYFLFLIF